MKKLIIIPLLLMSLTLASCGNEQEPARKTIYAMDTAAMFTVYGNNADAAISAAEEEIHRLDALLSRSGEHGDIYPLNESGAGTVSDESAYIIKTALDVSHETDGAFDITITPLMDAWGFFGQEYRVPSDAEISELLTRVDYNNVTLDGNNVTLNNNAAIDLGGIAKGYASENAMQVLKDNGVTSALISFSSAINAIGKKPDGDAWTIGIANPQNPEEYIVMLAIADTCVATSGSYEQVFKENGKTYHHILDPSTGYPTDNGLASVSVIGSNPTRADALSTALFVKGLDGATEFWRSNGGFEAVFITDSGEIYYTPGLEGSIFATNGQELKIIE